MIDYLVDVLAEKILNNINLQINDFKKLQSWKKSKTIENYKIFLFYGENEGLKKDFKVNLKKLIRIVKFWIFSRWYYKKWK